MGGTHARADRSWFSVGRLIGMTVGIAAVTMVVTGSLSATLEVTAVVAVLVGSAVALGAFDEPRTSRARGFAPDRRIAALAGHVLASLDGIEHRRVELGTPWPQLSVGPTGVTVVDVCGLEGPLVVDASGIGRRDDRGSCSRCTTAIDAGRVALDALGATDLSIPVRTVAVVAAGTEVAVAADALPDVHVVSVDELADVLARGPLLPMPLVDAAFVVLSGSALVADAR